MYQALLIIFVVGLVSCDHLNVGHDGIKPLNSSTTNVDDNLSEIKGRLAWQKPELVIESLGDLSDKTVVDVGAGTGYFTFRLAKKAKKVIAIDIDEKMINLIQLFRENLDSISQTKIETRLVPPDNPQLGLGEADVAIIINTIGYINNRVDYLKKLRKGMNEGSMLMIVDFKAIDIPDDIAPPMSYRPDMDKIVSDLKAAGFKFTRTNNSTLSYQYMILALN